MATQTIDLSQVADLVHNGVNLGYSKLMVNGIRAWEKYEVTETYQELVESGEYQTVTDWVLLSGSWSQYYNTYMQRWTRLNGYFYIDFLDSSDQLILNKNISVGENIRWSSSSYLSGTSSTYRKAGSILTQNRGSYTGSSWNLYRLEQAVSTTQWVDTSYYETRTRTTTAYYY